MLKKLRAKLGALTHSLRVQEPLHARAVRRMQARHRGQEKAEAQSRAARGKADALRAAGHKLLTFGAPNFDQAAGERKLRRAERKDRKAMGFDVKAEREKSRAVTWRGRARKIAKRIHGVEDDLAAIRKQVDQLAPRVDGNHVVGGDEFERWLVCLNTVAERCATGARSNFYSMAGSWDVDHLLTGESSGERSDCSQGQTAAIKACGFPDINGEDFHGGFTGTMTRAAGRWKQVSLEHMLKARRPGVIVYGSGNGHHTEGWCPSLDDDGNFIDAMRTVGHGSPPWDPGTVHLFGGGEVERYFILAAE